MTTTSIPTEERDSGPGRGRSGPALVVDVMTKAPRTLRRNDELLVADGVMGADRIRHLPVLDETGRLAGIVSQRDLFHSALVKALGFGTTGRDRTLKSMLVKEVMATEVVTTTPGTRLSEAARVMNERKIGCLPVLDDDRLVGIVTEGDMVALVAAGA